jgi:hypothetical protein
MVDDPLVVEQAHEIRSLAKELEGFKCELPTSLWVEALLLSCNLLGWTLQLLENIRDNSSVLLISLPLGMLRRR